MRTPSEEALLNLATALEDLKDLVSALDVKIHNLQAEIRSLRAERIHQEKICDSAVVGEPAAQRDTDGPVPSDIELKATSTDNGGTSSK
ncbi:hypothetical protein NW762_011190 [Fusarium torreyae]|uniref:Uncharacterized protein n=1 Tax=Fusarium torreyae TaxID=1237075 RepID=A0A9W8V9I1_9HYPO|nr:hypothetical protein NW762_011190 [Fusarium torreyae]